MRKGWCLQTYKYKVYIYTHTHTEALAQFLVKLVNSFNLSVLALFSICSRPWIFAASASTASVWTNHCPETRTTLSQSIILLERDFQLQSRSQWARAEKRRLRRLIWRGKNDKSQALSHLLNSSIIVSIVVTSHMSHDCGGNGCKYKKDDGSVPNTRVRLRLQNITHRPGHLCRLFNPIQFIWLMMLNKHLSLSQEVWDVAAGLLFWNLQLSLKRRLRIS